MPLARHDGVSAVFNRAHMQFLLTCLLRGMTRGTVSNLRSIVVSTHMPLARHDFAIPYNGTEEKVSTHMPLARHDVRLSGNRNVRIRFYSHASCEA